MIDKKVWVYDLELFRNFFSGVFYNVDTEETVSFVIHESRDDRVELLKFLDANVKGLIGFNNVDYDYPLLHYLLTYNKTKYKKEDVNSLLDKLYYKGQDIINSKYSSIRNKNVKIPQLDLYRIKHFNNKVKAVSLKWIEFALNWENLMDLPFKYDHVVSEDEIPDILHYNLNDVMATNEFYEKCTKDIELRKKLSKEFKLDLINANDPKIGEEIFAKLLSEDMNIDKWDLKKMRTKRDQICFSDCIFDYISYNSDHFNGLLKFLNDQCISETKGFFNDIPLQKVSKLLKYVNPSTIKSKSGKLKNLNIFYKDFQYDFGTGGIHGCIKSGVYKSDDDWVIIDADVKSYYPHLAFLNGIVPAHLGDSFNIRYKWFYDERVKIPKFNPLNAAYKLMLNGAYGKSNDEYSFLYDPKFAMTITINGQLSLVMLAEQIVDLFDCTMLQINTDGLTIKMKRKDVKRFYRLCEEWEKETNLILEYAEYEKMIIRDVNNYIAVYNWNEVDEKTYNNNLKENKSDIILKKENGKFYMKNLKLKGCFEIDRDWHKNHSMKIVPIALKKYFVDSIPVEDVISNCNDIFKFCKGVKSKGKNALELHSRDEYGNLIREPLQKTNRYYVSKEGKTLMKIMPPLEKLTYTEKYKQTVNPNQVDLFDFVEDIRVDPERESNVESGYKVTVFNNYVEKPIEDYGIDYEYYIDEAYKIINVIEKK